MKRVAITAISMLVLVAATAPIGHAESDEEAPRTRPKVVVLVSVTSPSGVATSFGTTGTDELPAYDAFSRALRARGFDIVSAAKEAVTRVATGEEVSANVLGDASAADLARRLGAGAAVIVALEARAEGAIRGTPKQGAIARGKARLLAVADSRVLSDAGARGAGFGSDNAAAVSMALAAALPELAEAMTDAAATAWPAPLRRSGNRMTVKIRKARTWAPISSIIRRLATTSGITAVHPREIRGSAVTLGIETGLGTSVVTTAIRGTRLLSGTLSAKTSDGGIIVTIRGD